MKIWTTTIVLLIVAASITWALWDRVAVMTAAKKEGAETRSKAAVQADEVFWVTFHGGDYDNIQRVLEALTAAYLEAPNDAKTAAHIAWLHNWRVVERVRMRSSPATITDDTHVARRYFEEAVKLDPTDARYRGFLAGHTLIEGNLHKDERLTRKGYFMMRDAIEMWPEFNLFTGGFVFSRLPPNSPQFKEGLEWQWRTLDICIGGKIDRNVPDYSAYMSLETTEGSQRACWNSWIAPHNFEGFFLNMGDMLVKAGDWRTAQKVYANAKLSKTYADWNFGSVLEDRIERAEANVAVFNTPDGVPEGKSDWPRLMIDSAFACVGCHQE
jgi:hypothetical protein